MILDHDVLRVSGILLLADLNLGLTIQTADTANAIRGRHQYGFIPVAMLWLQVVVVAVGLHLNRLLELNGRGVDRNLIRSIRLELDETGIWLVLRAYLFGLSALVVHDYQLWLVGVELQLVLALVRTRFVKVLAISELLTALGVLNVCVSTSKVRGRTRANRGQSKVILTGDDHIRYLTGLEIVLSLGLAIEVEVRLDNDWREVSAVNLWDRLDLQYIISNVSWISDRD